MWAESAPLLISLHIRSMWETICYAQAGLCTVTTHGKICVQILWRAPLWSFSSDSRVPPPMKNFRFEMTKVYSGIPPPQWKTSDLRWPKFTPEYPPPNEKLQIWDDQSLLRNTPPNEKLQIWDDQSLLRNTPPPQVARGSFHMWRLIFIIRIIFYLFLFILESELRYILILCV